MKKIVTFLGIMACVAILVVNNHQTAHTFSGMPPVGKTGADGLSDANLCTNCHVGVVNSGAGSIDILFNDGLAEYIAGETHNITVTVNDPNIQTKFGFEMEARDGAGNDVGEFVASAMNVAITEDSGRSYIHHLNADDNNTFDFEWIAPASGTGDVTFYAAGVAGNGNFQSSEDNTYAADLAVSETFPDGINDPNLANIHVNVYPNPVIDQINVNYVLDATQNIQIVVMDMSGKVMERLFDGQQTAGQQQNSFRISKENYQTGNYLLFIHGEDFFANQQFFVN